MPVHPAAAALLQPRWRGRPGRLEVWYATLTDPATRFGVWLHHEVLAPREGPAYVHGWLALFPAGASPQLHLFAPARVRPEASGPVDADGRWAGASGQCSWDLRFRDGSPPVFTMPRWAWRRGLLPGVQAVALPAAEVDGWIATGGERLPLGGARGAVARIYSTGHQERWAWLHADLGGGDVCEVVAGVPHRALLRHLPPVSFVQLRMAGRDWPGDPMRAAVRFRTRIDADGWRLTGRAGGRRLRVDVRLPDDVCVQVPYADADGSTARCRNSERADATIIVERRQPAGWSAERQWVLSGTAHAEIGSRP